MDGSFSYCAYYAREEIKNLFLRNNCVCHTVDLDSNLYFLGSYALYVKCNLVVEDKNDKLIVLFLSIFFFPFPFS